MKEIEIARFYDQEPLDDCVEVLERAGIPHRLATDAPIFDYASIGQGGTRSACMVMVSAAQEVAARQALLDQARIAISDGVPDDFHLNDWENQELLAVLQTPMEWNAFDVAAAEFILRSRGEKTPEVCFEPTKEPSAVSGGEETPPNPGIKEGSGFILAAGYLLATMGGWMSWMGLIGLAIGWSYAVGTETVSDGTRRFIYDERTRKCGLVLFLYSLAITLFFLVSIVYRALKN